MQNVIINIPFLEVKLLFLLVELTQYILILWAADLMNQMAFFFSYLFARIWWHVWEAFLVQNADYIRDINQVECLVVEFQWISHLFADSRRVLGVVRAGKDENSHCRHHWSLLELKRWNIEAISTLWSVN